MLMTLNEASSFKADVTQAELDGLEQMIRGLTHNHFAVTMASYNVREVLDGSQLSLFQLPQYLRVGDTVELIDGINDGVYVLTAIDGQTLALNAALIPCQSGEAFVTKISYPADVIEGAKQLLKYRAKMEGKLGIKSEAISRMNVSYYDVTSGESTDGFPASFLKFLDKYRKLRWS